MEKICKRCNFRTPASRKICQVCGHNKLVPMEIQGGRVVLQDETNATTPVQEPQFSAAMNEIGESFREQFAKFKTFVKNVETRIETFVTTFGVPQQAPAAVTAPVIEVPVQTIVTRPVRSATNETFIRIGVPTVNTPSPMPLPGSESLNELLDWFKSYGVSQSLILPVESTDDASDNCKAA